MNIINEIDKYLLNRETKRKRESHYPSDVSSCMRQLFWKWQDEKKSNPIEPGGYWKMAMGNKIHELIYDFLQQAHFDIENEVAGKKNVLGLKMPISYRIDNVFLENGKRTGIEVKTSYGAGIKWIQTKGEPKEQDLNQVVMYMFLEELDTFYLVYVGRDNAYRTEFKLNKEEYGKRFELLIQRLKTLETYLENKELPDRDYMVAIKCGEIKKMFQKNKVAYNSCWQCNYCPFRSKCWKKEIEKYKTSDNSEMFNKED